MKNDFRTSIIISSFITLFLVMITYTTSSQHPWFIYPLFAIQWWPLTLFYKQRSAWRGYSIVSSVIISLFFLVINLTTSPGFLWCLFPIFVIWWWPLSYVTCSQKKYVLHSILSTSYLSIFFISVNYFLTPNSIWVFYVIYPLIYWPISMIFASKNYWKLLSILMSSMIIGYLALVNLLETPETIWVTYAGVLLWWPVILIIGKKADSVAFSIIVSFTTFAYYIILYFVQTPEAHPWYLYLIFPLVWYPVTMFYRGTVNQHRFTIVSAIAFIAYYFTLNMIVTPNRYWFVEIILIASWVTIGRVFGSENKRFLLSVTGTLITISYFAVINYIYSPMVIWAVYPAFAIIWWPLSYYFFKVRKYS